METSIIIAIIGAAASIGGAVIAAAAASSKGRSDTMAELAKMQAAMSAEFAKAQAVTDTKIDQLTREVEKHNGVIERTYKLETDAANLFHRFEDTKSVADESLDKANHACERADAAHNRLDRAGVDKH